MTAGPLELPAGASGVLPSQLLRRAVAAGVIRDADEDRVQPASIDLRLGEVAYRVRCSFLPDQEAVEPKLKDHVLDELDLRGDGAVLETNRPYLIPLVESVELPAGVRARTNPKSSTGRLDVFTRVITDGSYRFDEIRAGYSGRLWLEVVPLSFTVRVRQGLALNQMRLIAGQAAVADEDLRARHAREAVLYRDGVPVPDRQFATSNGLFLSLDLEGDEDGRVGYRAKDYAPLIEMGRVGAYEPEDYWDPVLREGRPRVMLAPAHFYLLLSDESVVVPPDLAAEMTAYDPTSGELRTHYAGFFDPGFGFDPVSGLRGSRAALEVRAHDVPFMIEHRQRVCKLTFERMLAEPDVLYWAGIGSNYQGQVETLGKHFKRPRPAEGEAAPGPEPGPDQLGLFSTWEPPR